MAYTEPRPVLLQVNQRARAPREWEVLKAFQSPEPEKQIADRLGLSTHTFHVHVKKIYRKLQVRSRLSLIELCRGVENERLFEHAAGMTSRASECRPGVRADRIH